MITVPSGLSEWQAQIPGLRARAWQLLGDLPALFTPEPDVLWVSQRAGYRLEKIAFDNGAGALVYGYVFVPDELRGPAPAVVYNHFHGGRYRLGKDETLLGRGPDPAPGEMLAEAGFVVLAIDAYGFGEREHQGPMGEAEHGPATELSLFKRFLWEGRTLWGMIVRDDCLTLNYLLSRPDVDPARVGTTGMSMGGSRATWLAALDERVRVVIPIGQMTRYREFAAAGKVSLHSIYYFVPGQLASAIEMEVLTSLAAPRHQHILIGDQDPLSPIEGVRIIEAFTRGVYALFGARDQFHTTVFPGIGHDYTADMALTMRRVFQQHLLQ